MAWYRYEFGYTGWCPVVYHDSKKPDAPKLKVVSECWPVPASCLSEDGSPMFGRLREMFPEPREAE